MDKEVTDAWASALNKLGDMSEEKRRHFAILLVNLADCYTDDASAVVLIHRDDSLMMLSAGANEFEAAGMLDRANHLVSTMVTAEAPAKEMFN
jgi:hypothetical protein